MSDLTERLRRAFAGWGMRSLGDEAAEEIERLLEWHHKGRWNIREEGASMFVCRGEHEKHEACAWERYERNSDV